MNKSFVGICRLLLLVVAMGYGVASPALADVRISNDSAQSTQPAVGVGPDGRARIVWTDNRTDTYQIYWRSCNVTGPTGLLRTVTTSAASSTLPRISVDGSNRSHVVWREGGRIMYARLASGGLIESGPTAISSNGWTCDRPEIDTTPGGVSHIVYPAENLWNYNMEYTVVDAQGAVTRRIQPGNNDIIGVSKYPSVAVDPAGNAHMMWRDYAYGYYPLYIAGYSPSGALLYEENILDSHYVSWTAVLFPGSGYAWRLLQNSSGGQQRIFIYQGGGQSAIVSGPSGASQTRPRLAGAPGYPIYGAWTDDSTGTSRIVAGAWNDQWQQTETLIPVSDGSSTAILPDIDTDGAGRYFVVWSDSRHGLGEIYCDAVMGTRLKVLAEARPEHEDDDIPAVLPPLAGATVTLTQGPDEWRAVTDEQGEASFLTSRTLGGEFEIALDGPFYRVKVDRLRISDLDPVTNTVDVDTDTEPTGYTWQSGYELEDSAALQAAYFIERYRTTYLRDQLGYEWTLPSRFNEIPGTTVGDSVLVTIYQWDATLFGAQGATTNATTIGLYRKRGLESDIVLHEFTHGVVVDCTNSNGFSRHWLGLKDEKNNCLNTESCAMDEAFADYFTASYTNDSVIARCGDMMHLIGDCEPLRDIDQDEPYPTESFGHDIYAGSLILSGAMWDLRRAVIDGGGTATEIDTLFFQALNHMLEADPRVGEPLSFDDYYLSLIAVDALNGGNHLADIQTQFGNHNIGIYQSPFIPASFPNNQAIMSIDESGPGLLDINWQLLEGASSYAVIGTSVEWGDYNTALGDYFTLAEGITDTTWTYDRRSETADYLIAIVPVDADGYHGYRSDLVYVAPLVPSSVPGDGSVPDADASRGRWLFNSPNPFNPRTTIHFETPRADLVQVRVYDLAGRLVRDMGTRQVGAGRHSVTWDGLDDRGRGQGSGVYLVRLVGRDWEDRGKIALMR